MQGVHVNQQNTSHDQFVTVEKRICSACNPLQAYLHWTDSGSRNGASPQQLILFHSEYTQNTQEQ